MSATPTQPASFCRKCGDPLRAGAKFCRGCGAAVPHAPLGLRCPSCHRFSPADSSFCHSCGVPLSAQTAPMASDAPASPGTPSPAPPVVPVSAAAGEPSPPVPSSAAGGTSLIEPSAAPAGPAGPRRGADSPSGGESRRTPTTAIAVAALLVAVAVAGGALALLAGGGTAHGHDGALAKLHPDTVLTETEVETAAASDTPVHTTSAGGGSGGAGTTTTGGASGNGGTTTGAGTAPGDAGNTTGGSGGATNTTNGSGTDSQTGGPALESYSGPGYSAEVPSGWSNIEDGARKQGYVESKWQDPHDHDNYVLIDSSTSTGASSQRFESPAQMGEPVRRDLHRERGYQELGYQPTTLGTTSAQEWVFRVPTAMRVDYFFEQCSHGFAVLGSTTPADFAALASTFRAFAQSVHADACS